MSAAAWTWSEKSVEPRLTTSKVAVTRSPSAQLTDNDTGRIVSPLSRTTDPAWLRRGTLSVRTLWGPTNQVTISQSLSECRLSLFFVSICICSNVRVQLPIDHLLCVDAASVLSKDVGVASNFLPPAVLVHPDRGKTGLLSQCNDAGEE